MSDKTGTYEHFIKPAKPQPQYPRELNHVLVDSLDKLTKIFSENEGKYIAWDTETSSLDPTVGTIVGFSFAYDDKTGYYVPLRHKPGGNIEDPEKALDLFYNHLLKAKVSFLYNARFDLRFMEYQGYDMGCLKFYDVYIGAWLADTNNKTMSLKANEKHFLGWDPDTFTETIGDSYDFSYLNVKDCYIYASADALGTFALCMKTIGYYKESKLSGKLSNQFLYPLMKYEDNGTLIDIDYLSNMLIEQNDRLKELENKIYKEVGYPFKINSNKQLGDALQSMGVNTGVYTKGGQMKVDIPTLSHYNFKNPTPIIDTLIEYSKLFKMINSYTSTLLDEANRQGGRCRFGYITGRVPCLTEDAKVLIKNRGIVSIKDVQKGDKIHTQYGYYEVLDTSNYKSDTIYKVTLSDGTILKGSPNHPILISRSINPRPNTVGNMWSTLSALSVGDIAIMNSRMPKSLETPRLTAFSYNGKFLSMSKSFMRLLGYLVNPRNYTDGDTIKIKMYRDYKFSIYVNILNNVFPKKPFIIQDKSIIIKDVEVIKILRYFMELMKTRVPHLILSSSPSYLKYFLTGVYDGCAIFRSSNVTSPQKPTLVFHNKEVAETIFEIHKAIGLNVTLSFNGNYNIHYKTMKGNYKFFNIIGKFLANPRYIETNINSYYEISENRATVESIEILPADTVYHIEVDQVHEYIANGIITHNTGRLAGSGDKKNTYFSNINIQSIPKAPSMNWYVHEYHEGDELKPYDEVVCGYRFSLEDKSKYIIEGRTPKENIRKALLPEKDGYWVSMDYSGQELRAIANLTGEKRWINTFLDGGDLHRSMAIGMWGEENYDKDKRKRAKVLNFGMAYGMSPYSIAEKFDVTVGEGKDIYERFWKAAPTIKAFQSASVRKAKKLGTIYNYFGMPRRVSYWLNSDDYKQQAFGKRTVNNTIIQSFGAELLKMAIIKTWTNIISNPKYDGKAFFMNTIHDEINFSFDKDSILELVQEAKKCMEVKFPNMPVPFVTGLDIGNSMGVDFPFVIEDGKLRPDWEIKE